MSCCDFFFSITGFNLFTSLTILFFLFFLFLLFNNLVIKSKYYIVLKNIFYFFENMVFQIIGKTSFQYFTLLFSIFWYIFLSNIMGLIPLTQSTTSHFIITFSLAFLFVLGLTYKGMALYGLDFLNVFLHWGTSRELAPILLSIEIISYAFRPLSLGIRLFANIMAGHILIKILLGFLSVFFVTNIVVMAIPSFILLTIISLLFSLELLIGLLQAYVFTLLCGMYINESCNM